MLDQSQAQASPGHEGRESTVTIIQQLLLNKKHLLA